MEYNKVWLQAPAHPRVIFLYSKLFKIAESEERAAGITTGQQQGRTMAAADFSFRITKAGTVIKNPTAEAEAAVPQTYAAGRMRPCFKQNRTGRLKILVSLLKKQKASQSRCRNSGLPGIWPSAPWGHATCCNQCQGWHLWAAVVKPGFLKDLDSCSVPRRMPPWIWLKIIQLLFFFYPPIRAQTLPYSLESLQEVAAQFLFFLWF